MIKEYILELVFCLSTFQGNKMLLRNVALLSVVVLGE